jgi:hypothetical protein
MQQALLCWLGQEAAPVLHTARTLSASNNYSSSSSSIESGSAMQHIRALS